MGQDEPLALLAQVADLLQAPAKVAGRLIRFRTNLFRAGGHTGACLRVVRADIPDFEWAGFPAELGERLSGLRDGLVIVTGPTGSGKTTTMAMIVNLLNQAGGYRIVTVEEPVEYLFPRVPNSVVTQREVGEMGKEYLDRKTFDELVRWIDSLDKL